MPGFKRCLLLIFLASTLCVGCLQSLSPPAFTSEPAILFNPNPQAPLAAIVKFSTNKPVRTAIRIKDGEWERELVYDRSHIPEDGLPVVGLVPDRTHELRVFIHDKFGRLTEAADPISFHTMGLPEDEASFPEIEMNVYREESMEPGMLILNVNRRAGLYPGMLVAINRKGKVVWYYRSGDQIEDFQRQRDGNLMYVTQDGRAVEIDWLGNVLSEGSATSLSAEAPEAVRDPDGPAEKSPANVFVAYDELAPLQGQAAGWTGVRELSSTHSENPIADVVLTASSADTPYNWAILGAVHVPYLIPCNYCFEYPAPRVPGRRPF